MHVYVTYVLHVLLFATDIIVAFLLLVIAFLHSSYFSPYLVFYDMLAKFWKKNQNEMKQNENSFF